MINMLKITLKQLYYFTVVAENKSFASAAKVLNISQPAITSAISLLEARFEVELLLRHHAQGVTLTSAGQDLLSRAHSLLIHAKELEVSTIDLSETLHGRLNIGCFNTIAPMYMPSMITNFLNVHKKVDLRLHEGTQKDLIGGLKDGRFDFVFMYHVDSTLSYDQDLKHQSLIRSKPYVLVSKNHPLVSLENVSLKKLINYPMVLLDIEPSKEYFLSLFRKKNLIPSIHYHSPSFETVRGFVASGMGYSILITQPKNNYDYNGNSLKIIDIQDDVEPGNLTLTHLKKRRQSRLMQEFEKFTIKNFDNFKIIAI